VKKIKFTAQDGLFRANELKFKSKPSKYGLILPSQNSIMQREINLTKRNREQATKSYQASAIAKIKF